MASPQTPDLFASGQFVRASVAPMGDAAPAPQAVTVNTDDYTLRELARAREATFSGLFGALDAKRPRAWDQYGYPESITFAALLQAYERGGAAKGAVHRLLDKCWQDCPRIKQPAADAETDWEKRVAKELRRVGAWRKLRDLDRRNMVGRYAAVIYRVRDGRQLREPLGRGQLVDLVPLYEDQIKVTAWNSDTESEDYGKPAMFQFQSRRVTNTDTQGAPIQWQDVHPSRVQILAEGSATDDLFDGVPLLLAGFNHLVDLEKIAGGSAESFLKNSARTVVVKFDGNASVQQLAQKAGQALPSAADSATALNDKVKDLNRNIDSALLLKGGEASTLQTTQHDPEPSFTVAANLFSASVQIPFTILFGQQTGRLASDQDQADWAARCHSRRENELTPMIEQFVRRMQACGALEAGEFEVEWEDLNAPSDADKLDNAKKMAEIAKTAAEAGITQPVFDANEIRGAADFEERADDGMPEEGDLTPEDQAAQEAVAAAAVAAGQRQPPPARPRLAAA